MKSRAGGKVCCPIPVPPASTAAPIATGWSHPFASGFSRRRTANACLNNGLPLDITGIHASTLLCIICVRYYCGTAMSTPSLILACTAVVFYLLTWKYILQLVSEVNHGSSEHRVSMWWWHKGWKVHRTLFPDSPVRTRLLTCIAVTVGLGLVFCIEARHLFERMQPR